MKRVVVTRFGGPDVLEVVEGPEPVPGPGEVTVRVLAAGLSFTDTLLRAGTYPGGPKPPFTPGYELAGLVEKVGSGCRSVHPGDYVAALVVSGGNAEVVAIPETMAMRVPGDVDPAVVVSLIFPYMTAFQLLHRAAKARAGETVLYHGAAGRVGTALLEIARHTGLLVYGTARGADCHLVERRGGIAIDYTREDFLQVIRSAGGADVVIDGIGGAVSLESLRALRRGGRLVLFGHQSTLVGGHRSWLRLAGFYGAAAATFLVGWMSPRRHVCTYRIAKLRDQHPEWFAQDFGALIALLRQGYLHPAVAERIPLTDVRRAHDLLDAGGVPGKLVLIPQSNAGPQLG